jgi:carboxyl-terminal processing protease
MRILGNCLLSLTLWIAVPVSAVLAETPARVASSYQSGADLQATIALLQEQSINEKGAINSLDTEKAYRELVVAQDVEGKGRDPRTVEYNYIRKLLRTYGMPGDTLLTPSEFQSYRQDQSTTMAVTAVAPGISHIQIQRLDNGSVSQVTQALHQVPYDRGVILDLRGTTGDDPQSVADIARQFLPASFENLVSVTHGRNKASVYKSNLRPLALETPLAVLIDGNTRGGAEALAAQLGRTNRAQVFGSTSRGSDLYSEVFALPTGAALRLGIGRLRMGDGRSLSGGVQPTELATGDPLNSAIQALSSKPTATLEPNIFPATQKIGTYTLGFNAGTGDLGIPGSVEYFAGLDANALRPKDELKIWYVPDYTVFNYKPRSSILNFFGDRIYTTASNAMTDKGIRIGSTFNDVLAAYGGSGQAGYNEINPYPAKARGNRQDRYYVNYDALGISFGFETGSNLVKEIGIYKPGS